MTLSSRDIRLLAGRAGFRGRQWTSETNLTFEQDGEHGLSQLVADIMSADVQIVSPDVKLSQLAKVMQHSASPCVVVVDQGIPSGIVTQRDLIKLLALALDDPQLWSSPVHLHMSRPVHTLPVHTPLHHAQRLFEARRFNLIPVVAADGRLVGLLSRERLAEAHMQALEKQRRNIERQVYTRSRELQKANRQLQALALEDSLLKIGNRRALELDAQSMHMNAVRHQHPYSLALLDVDYFKHYNDHYGHCAGDHALIAIVECLKDSLRRGDRLYRYGGEELLLMMPETSQAEAMEAVWRAVKNLYQLNLEHRSSPFGRLTISGGVSTYNTFSTGLAWNDILEQADHHLYRAKAMGRNCVYGANENLPPKTHHS